MRMPIPRAGAFHVVVHVLASREGPQSMVLNPHASRGRRPLLKLEEGVSGRHASHSRANGRRAS